jgi:hypothetical protein
MAKTFADLIGTWPRGIKDGRARTSIQTFALDIGITDTHAQVMRFRNDVRPDYWPAVLRAAKKRGVRITFDELVRMREKTRRLPKARPNRLASAGAAVG